MSQSAAFSAHWNPCDKAKQAACREKAIPRRGSPRALPRLLLFSGFCSLGLLLGCAITTGQTNFALEVSPAAITVVAGGAAQTLTIGVTGANGNVAVTVGSLPAGVTAMPALLSIAPGTLAQVSISASADATPSAADVVFTGTLGAQTQGGTASLRIMPQASTTVSFSATSFDFGDNLVNNTVTQTVVAVGNTGSVALTLSPTVQGDNSYTIAPGTSCGQQLAAGAHCDMVLSYDPKTPSAPASQNATLNMGFGNVSSDTPEAVAITGIAAALSAGQVTATNNPQVALYTMTLPFPGAVTIDFGTTTAYGLETWARATGTAGGAVSIFVAGMRGNTLYHMQASVLLANGITTTDMDQTFTTGPVPPNMEMGVTTTTTPGMTPQPGLEVLNPLGGHPTGIVVTDLAGNLLWTYGNPGDPGLNFIDGVKMLPNGDFLLVIGPNSGNVLDGPLLQGTINEIREVNLAGDTVREISVDDLNAELATAATCTECNVTLEAFHHDVEPLPNGHWLVLANTTMMLSTTTTPAFDGPPTAVLGDVIVDLDQNLRPVWAWNEFNHLDPNREGFAFPDWTHTNAVLYSKDDGDIVVSLRHQNWILKVSYANGTGDGSILWRLGEGGDFTLEGGTDPTDWEYAQHGPSFFSANTSGTFSLGVMDNGNDRIFPAGVTCGSPGAPPCFYTTVPIWRINEEAKTAALTFHQILPANLSSSFGGNAEQLQNGDVEYDLCTPGQIYEVTEEPNPQTVWNMTLSTVAYRAFRIPSLYPGVQW